MQVTFYSRDVHLCQLLFGKVQQRAWPNVANSKFWLLTSSFLEGQLLRAGSPPEEPVDSCAAIVREASNDIRIRASGQRVRKGHTVSLI